MKEMIQKIYAGTLSSLFAGVTIGAVTTAIFLPGLALMGDIYWDPEAYFGMIMGGVGLTLVGMAGAFFWLLPIAGLADRFDRNTSTSRLFSLQGLATLLVLGTIGSVVLFDANFHEDPTLFFSAAMIGAFAGSGVFSWFYPRLKASAIEGESEVTKGDTTMGYVSEVNDTIFETEITYTKS